MRVKYESMRRELIAMLGDFGTPELDLQWLSAAPGEPWSRFDEWWEIIEDLLPDGAKASIGYVVADALEAEIIDRFLDVFSALYEDLGRPVEFERYSSDPRWSELTTAALAAASRLRENSPELASD